MKLHFLILLLFIFIPVTFAQSENPLSAYPGLNTAVDLGNFLGELIAKKLKSGFLDNQSLSVQELSTDAPSQLRQEDFLFERQKQEQYDLQETMLDLIVGVFVIFIDMLIILYFILELWFFMKLFTDWIPRLFRKLANNTGEMIVNWRSLK